MSRVPDVHAGLVSALVPAGLSPQDTLASIQGGLVELPLVLIGYLDPDGGAGVAVSGGYGAERVQCPLDLVEGV